tara:strand:- start:176 stop:607 length:432 start_codon:yes stop_codon:yes gene_type:complete
MIKTFRGKLADGATQRIRLSTNDGLTGYKINKFQICGTVMGSTDDELTAQIFLQEPASAIATVNFDNPLLLGVALYNDAASGNYGNDTVVIFDSMAFNQDIYITAKDSSGNAGSTNYYIELEQIKLDLNEATVATLKDMRGRE